MEIPIAKPYIGKEEELSVSRVLSSGWVSQGPEVVKFEHDFMNYVGAEYACAVSSCTAGLHLALLSLGVKPGDEVITVSHSFIATANAILYCGAKPVFIDIDKKTFNIDVDKIVKRITTKTKCILCVHQMGMPCNLKKILSIAKKYSLYVIEDAACSLGSEILWEKEWVKIGKPIGDIVCFSFHPRKIITTGDGGMVTTSIKEIDTKLRLLRQHYMGVPDTDRHSSKKIIFESYDGLGYNYRLTDIQAAIGIEQLKKIDKIILKRRLLSDRYKDLLSVIDGLILPHEPNNVKSNWQSFCVYLPKGINQKEAMQYLLDRGISTRRGIMCAHKEKTYRQNTEKVSLKNSEFAQENSILLPLFVQMTKNEQDYVVDKLREVCGK